jgi:hypothetical protein
MRTHPSLHRSDSLPSWFHGSRRPATGPSPSPASDRHATPTVDTVPVARVDGARVGATDATRSEDLAHTEAHGTRWPRGLTPGAVGSLLLHLAASPSRRWSERTSAQQAHLQIGSGLDVVVADMRGHEESAAVAMLKVLGLTPGRRGEDYADGVAAGHILRTRPATGSFVPMGTSVDYVVASSVSGSRHQPPGYSDFVDHDATARLTQEAP